MVRSKIQASHTSCGGRRQAAGGRRQADERVTLSVLRSQNVKFRKRTGLAVYLSDPHSPWQRGCNENSIDLVREHLPRRVELESTAGVSLAAISSESTTDAEKYLGVRSSLVMYRLSWASSSQ